jgi:diguanylate cyclase
MAERMAQMEQQSRQAQANLEEQRKKLMRDRLTELPNREAYELRIAEELHRFERYQRPFAFAVADLDHFKAINDTYGHLAGDKVLKVAAKVLRQRLRRSDFIARYGGEEFVIIMPETSAQDAVKTLDGIRLAIEQCPFHFHETRIKVTSSFGVTACIDGDSVESLFARADQALYQAKEAGRNRCQLAENG